MRLWRGRFESIAPALGFKSNQLKVFGNGLLAHLQCFDDLSDKITAITPARAALHDVFLVRVDHARHRVVPNWLLEFFCDSPVFAADIVVDANRNEVGFKCVDDQWSLKT